MAEACKDIDKALANLARKIDEQSACCNANKQQIADLNRRLAALENGSNKQGQNKPTDLTTILQRLSRIENYINILDAEFTAISQIIKSINEHLEPLFKILDDFGGSIIKAISNLIGIFTGKKT